MSLNWNVENVANHEQVCFIGEGDERQLNPVTNALIWSTISTKMGEITEKNAAEFYARLKFHERVSGHLLVKSDGEPYWITPEDVQAHVGLQCNVVTETRAKFLGSFKFDLEDFAGQYNKATLPQPVR